MGFLFEQTIEQIRRIFQSAGDGNAMDIHLLIDHPVIPGNASLSAEITPAGGGMGRTHRNHETQAIGHGDFAASPGMGQGNCILHRHQPGIGLDNGFGANVVMAHPGQPAAGQRGNSRVYEGRERQVGSFRQQRRTQTEVQVSGTNWPFADMGEVIQTPGPSGHFLDHIGDAYSWQQGVDSIA